VRNARPYLAECAAAKDPHDAEALLLQLARGL
jgi:hypothetical protein